MTPQQWNQIKHFNPKEKWGDPEKMDFRLVWMLDQIRQYFIRHRRIIIHCGYETSGHSKHSFHHRDGVGRAVDFHVEGIWKNKNALIAHAGRLHEYLPFCRLGVYPDWNNPGYHVDVSNYTTDKYTRWVNLNGEYKYFESTYLDSANYCRELKEIISK